MNTEQLEFKDFLKEENVYDGCGCSSYGPCMNHTSKPQITIHGAHVATERLKTTAIQTKTVAGLGFLQNKNGLDELKVMFDCECLNLRAGDSVFIRQNQYNAAWSAAVYTLEEKEFILVPKDCVIATKGIKDVF